MSKKATEFQKKEMSKMYRGKEIFKHIAEKGPAERSPKSR